MRSILVRNVIETQTLKIYHTVAPKKIVFWIFVWNEVGLGVGVY